MVFCSNCGEELPEKAAFCPKCGSRTGEALQEGVLFPSDELRDELSEVGDEIRKAFQIAAKEIEEAFKTARESIRESTGRSTYACPSCGEMNPNYARFCHKCGGPLK